MKKVLLGFLLRAPVSIKDFGEWIRLGWIANLGKSLHETARRKIKVGWLI